MRDNFIKNVNLPKSQIYLTNHIESHFISLCPTINNKYFFI